MTSPDDGVVLAERRSWCAALKGVHEPGEQFRGLVRFQVAVSGFPGDVMDDRVPDGNGWVPVHAVVPAQVLLGHEPFKAERVPVICPAAQGAESLGPVTLEVAAILPSAAGPDCQGSAVAAEPEAEESAADATTCLTGREPRKPVSNRMPLVGVPFHERGDDVFLIVGHVAVEAG